MASGIYKPKTLLAAGAVSLCLVLYYFSLPPQLFETSYSTVLEADNGQLLSASIARDGQWRFPPSTELPQRFVDALVLYEDKRFWHHAGVDALALLRALQQNVQSRKIVRGGSTLSMQVIRLSRNGKPRTIFNKLIETVLATRLELRFNKNEILNLYASHAPFGGNVVGLEAACWRYFGRSPVDLSWAEAAMLAVLPNSPSLIHPGKNRETLKQKRNALLQKLFDTGKIDAFTLTLAKEEPLPEAPHPLPRMARHLLSRLAKEGFSEKKVSSTIDFALQQRIEQIIQDHHYRLSGNHIYNAAAIVAEVKTGNVLAYVGNIPRTDHRHSPDVDVITSPRSTGSILKPILYAALLDEGKILPHTLLPDIPVLINGFSPKNFSKQYDGAVAADQALIRSLNIPAVYMLQEYRFEKFHSLLKQYGMTTLQKPPDHYGLSLILGGAEGTLWDITGLYASMARTLNHFFERPGKNKYRRSDNQPLRYLPHNAVSTDDLEENNLINASALYQAFEALKEVYRPGEESGWRNFFSSKKIAWKTGTSFGFRDGWAIGVTPGYVVGVWVGNADGEGRPGLTGTETAAPVMFDIFSLLPETGWFRRPELEMMRVVTCKKSGYRYSIFCQEADTSWITKAGANALPCPYHKNVHLTKDFRYRVHSGCESITNITTTSWFILPPVQEYYFRSKTISYKALPPYRPDCAPAATVAAMDLIYPKPHAKIFIPRDLNGRGGSVILQLAHRVASATVYWHLDGEFLGTTTANHAFPVKADEGVHRLTIVDENGETLEHEFEVLSKM